MQCDEQDTLPHAHSLVMHVKSYLLTCVQGLFFTAVQNKSQLVTVTLHMPPRQDEGAPLQRTQCRAWAWHTVGLSISSIPYLMVSSDESGTPMTQGFHQLS